jgi:hypothetical protein
MAIPGIQEIQALATKYSKPQLQKMAQMGLIDPTKAVMAGMMIDRIQKQNMQMPQQTVADEVMGSNVLRDRFGNVVRSGSGQAIRTGVQQDRFGNVIRSSDRQSEGIAGLPSNLPEEMAGGGIVAFADGGDIDDYADGGVVGYADRGLVDSRNDPAMRIDPQVQAERDRLSIPYLMDDLEYARRTGDPELIAAAEREVRRRLGKKPNANISIPGISEARAADPRRQSKAAATDVDYYQDPLGAPDYTTEGFSLKEKVEPGKKYDPSLRGLLFGYEEGKLPDITPPEKAKTKPEAAPAPVPKAAEKVAAKVEKAEVGPARPSAEQRLENQLAGLSGKAGKELTPDEVINEQDKMFERLGVNKDFFTNLRRDYESTRGKFQDRADKAAGHALMMFGAGLMGARRGEEFATASKAAQQSLMMYMSSMDKISDQEEKLNKDLRDLSISEENYRRSRATSALETVQKNREKVADRQVQIAELENRGLVALTNAAVEQFKATNPAEYVKYKRIAEETGKSIEEVIKMFNIQKSGEISRTTAFKEYNDLIANPLSREETKRLYPGGFDDYFRVLQGGGAGGGGGKVDTSNPLLRQ